MTALYGGVDVGASSTKLVLIDEHEVVLARDVRLSGVDYAATARDALQTALATVAVPAPALTRVVSTGYGRHNVDFADASHTELQCHGVGCYHHRPEALTIIDIGGQDNKVIRLGPDGRRLDFKMNRKCAAGTGAFIEEIALRLALPLSEMEPLAAGTQEAVRLSSFCTVFAKTEILSHLRQGVPVAQIVRGAFQSVIQRVVEMDPLNSGTVMITGGVVAHNPTIARILAQRLGREVVVPPEPQLTGALGAALMARRQTTTEPARAPDTDGGKG